MGWQDETSSVAAGGASEPQLLRADPSLLPATAPSASQRGHRSEPAEGGYGLGLLRRPSSGVTAERSPGQKTLNRILQPFPKGNGPGCNFRLRKSLLSRGTSWKAREVTALDLLPSRDSIYVKFQVSPQQRPLLNPSVPQESNLQFGHHVGDAGIPRVNPPD